MSSEELAERTEPDRALEVAERLSLWMDKRYLDPLLGFVLPGVGDLISAGLGVYPVVLAWRRGAPHSLLARMLLNLAIDAATGAVPVLGDIWDFFFKAHSRNLALLRARSEGREVRSHWSDAFVLAMTAAAFLVALAVPVAAAIALWRVFSR